MDLFRVLVLGFVQGTTEFLPISSTAHLILLPWFFGFKDPGLTFDIALHLGTLLAILIYFRKEWVDILKRSDLLGGRTSPGKLLLIATVPGILFGILFESWAETFFRTPSLIATALAFFGLLLWLVDSKSKRLNDLNHLNKKTAFFIGCWQALAIIPGVSRSGASITGGLLVGLKREEAVKFSFLLSAPIILASVILGVIKVGRGGESMVGTEGLVLGVLFSFFSGILSIKFLLKFVQKNSFYPFVIYRIILAVLILALVLTRVK